MTQHDGLAALTQTARPERLEENFNIFDFELSKQDMATMADLAEPDGRIVLEPELAPDFDPRS